MSILTISKLSQMFDDKLLFEDGELSINNGEHCGIVGLNGAGKTTFMNIIAGKIMQDSGEIKWGGGVKWGYLDQHADIDRTLTVMEYLEGTFRDLFTEHEKLEKMYADMCDETLSAEQLDTLIDKSSRLMDKLQLANFFELEAQIKKVANGLGIGAFGYDTKVSTLSGGQRAKLMLAKLLLSDLDVMLLDEPTNFLDIEHIAWLAEFLDSFKGTFLLVSHDTDFLNKVCKIIINIENKQIKKYAGSYDQFMLQRESNAKQYEENYLRQQREIKKMEDYIARNKARASTAGMANSRKKMLERIDVMEKPTVFYPAVFNFPYVTLNTKELLKVDNLEVGYSSPLLPPISFLMQSGTKLWIRGTNGIGKSTMLKTLMGKLRGLGGSYDFHINAKIGYIEQDLEFRNLEINPMLYMNELYPKYSQKDVRSKLAGVGIKNDLATRPIKNLSGGEQVRVKLCDLMQVTSNLLILDEPTNHLDIMAKESLKEGIKKYPGALILVSHEPNFAEEVCNETVDLF